MRIRDHKQCKKGNDMCWRDGPHIIRPAAYNSPSVCQLPGMSCGIASPCTIHSFREGVSSSRSFRLMSLVLRAKTLLGLFDDNIGLLLTPGYAAARSVLSDSRTYSKRGSTSRSDASVDGVGALLTASWET